MSRAVNQSGVNRREFMSYAMALGGMTAAASVVGPASAWGAVNHKPLDPINPDILFGSTSSLWGGQRDIEWAIKRIAALGLQGIEPYANQIEKYRSNPLALKKIFDDAGRIADAPTAARVREYADAFAAFVQQHQRMKV